MPMLLPDFLLMIDKKASYTTLARVNDVAILPKLLSANYASFNFSRSSVTGSDNAYLTYVTFG